ncbi:fungal-specific transcription factor domain-containing protein [Aspergillus cavernicola]|uniref:Fungal-specific transcription factor domain-containing protein n=1 Tax=Aspergillus cavernicola TaxID=176166 RepID=A0ABR4J5D0_9EURO
MSAPNLVSQAMRRPCDRCRHRKSRCVRELGQEKCVRCTVHRHECTYLQGPVPRKRPDRQQSPRAEDLASNGLSPSPPAGQASSDAASPSRLTGTLGLEPHLHSTYIGPASYHESTLLDLKSSSTHVNQDMGHPRRVNQSSAFITRPDKNSASEMQRISDLDQIEATINPFGPALVKVYFQIVHPLFPILDKGVFVEKYARTYREFSPPLLAAVYLVALDWRLFDRALTKATRVPDTALLEDLAMRAMNDDMKRAKLSTLQAGLLLLQRVRSTSTSLPAQLLAVGQTLGIHVDCSDWTVPEWEKSLRRRLAWALYKHDKWGAIVHGRPSLIPIQIENSDFSDWDVGPCTFSDFPEATDIEEDDMEGIVDAGLGRAAFIQLIELTKIFSEIVATFCSVSATRKGGLLSRIGTTGTMSLAKPLVLKLRDWHSSLPDNLQLGSTYSHRLSTNGPLHLSHMAAELTIHRALLRTLSADTPPALRSTIRTAARARLLSAMKLIESLQPEHTQSFWGFAAASQVAMIGSFAGLLWATSAETDEAVEFVNQLERLRWALQMRASAAPFLHEALRMLDDEVGDLVALRTATSADQMSPWG